MSESTQDVNLPSATQFVLIAVKREAAYWTPRTIAQELFKNDILASPSEAELAAFAETVLRGLVGRSAEKFWASDAVTPPRAAAIRSACRALNSLTVDLFAEAVAEVNIEGV